MARRNDTLALALESADQPDEQTVREQASLYRASARRWGVEFIGIVEKHWIVLFQDPITGSSFAVLMGESVESGIRRVRERFGVV